MPSLPIPLISALVLGFLLVRMWLTDRRHGPLVMLLALCAVQGLVVSLAQHYRVPGMASLQPIMATTIPPMAWIAFVTTAMRRFQTRDLAHAAWPIVSLLVVVLHPPLLDLLIPLLFLIFGGMILRHSLKGADALPRMRLEAGDLPGRIWQVIGLSLIATAFSDVLIIAAVILGAGYLQPWIISVYSSVLLLVIGVLSLSGALVNAPSEVEEAQEPDVSEIDTQIVARLDALMTREKLFLNPELTLSQLSRKLLIPVKQLSAAINRVTGENVSRYINAARINAAQNALLAGETVTSAMLSSGFNTKSNFNREFLRVVGRSPSDWLEAHNHQP